MRAGILGDALAAVLGVRTVGHEGQHAFGAAQLRFELFESSEFFKSVRRRPATRLLGIEVIYGQAGKLGSAGSAGGSVPRVGRHVQEYLAVGRLKPARRAATPRFALQGSQGEFDVFASAEGVGAKSGRTIIVAAGLPRI